MARSASIAPRIADWSSFLTLDQVDQPFPSAGVTVQPTTIGLDFTGSLYSSVAIESLERAASHFSSTTSSRETLYRPDGSIWFTVAPSTNIAGTLAAYDGTSDAAGTSGIIWASNAVGTLAPLYGPSGSYSPDAGLLFGTGTVTGSVVATARVDAIAPGNFAAEFASDIAASASVGSGVRTSPAAVTPPTGVIVTPVGPAFPTTLFPAGIQVRQELVQIAPAATGTNETISVAGLNPALGTLVGVDLDLLATATGNAYIENLDPVASIVSVSQAASISLSRPDGSSLVSEAAPGISFHTVLAGSDGTLDFAGRSGTHHDLEYAPTGRFGLTLRDGSNGSVVAYHGSNDTLFTDMNTISAFNTGTPLTLETARTGVTAVSGPGNLAITAALQTGGAALVTYLYTPNP